MSRLVHRFTRLAVPTVMGAAVAVAAAAPAAAAPASVTIDGNVQVLGLSILHVDAEGAGDGPATGTYLAEGRLGNMPLPVRVVGPVTCLTVVGNTASLIYPITASAPVTVFAPDTMAIQITVTKGDNGQPNRIGYGLPMPTTSFRGCAPGPTPLLFDGTIDIRR